MKYFVILGSNPSLSVSELYHFFKNQDMDLEIEVINREVVFLDSQKEIDCQKIIKNLGGAIKIGLVLSEVKKPKLNNLIDVINTKIEKIDYKFKFGFSFYGRDYFSFNSLAMDLKNELKKDEVSSRWIISKEKNLSSVVVEQNKLVDKGIDFFVTSYNDGFALGFTKAVQDFKGLSKRDYGRPERDDVSGMLPPKLAQIMINISEAKKDSVFLDPFCGSGTVLSEAALMNYKNINGSDFSQKAVDDSLANLLWLEKNNNISFNLKVSKKDVTKISDNYYEPKIDVVVTEPYLGPQRGAHNILKTVEDLEKLYSQAIKELSKIMARKSRIVMIWPVFVSRSGEKKRFFLNNVNLADFKIKPLLPNYLLNNDLLKLSKKGGIVYGRPGQKIWREVILLEKDDKKNIK